MMPRERLPNRRRALTDNAFWPLEGGRRVHVTLGFAEDGRSLELFARGGGRVSSETDFVVDDAAVLISRLLQHGDKLEDIARGVGRLPDGRPSSVIGAILDTALSLDRDAGGA
jgi:hypothetical protein